MQVTKFSEKSKMKIENKRRIRVKLELQFDFAIIKQICCGLVDVLSVFCVCFIMPSGLVLPT